MTGPAYGKVPLSARVFLITTEGILEVPAEVYIHVKGYALARVTHLDIEHEWLDNIIPPKRGVFAWITGVKSGIQIKLDQPKAAQLNDRTYHVERIRLEHPLLNQILRPGERTRTWVGGKFGGIYIGFRKKHIPRLEHLARHLGFTG